MGLELGIRARQECEKARENILLNVVVGADFEAHGCAKSVGFVFWWLFDDRSVKVGYRGAIQPEYQQYQQCQQYQ